MLGKLTFEKKIAQDTIILQIFFSFFFFVVKLDYFSFKVFTMKWPSLEAKIGKNNQFKWKQF
jgi:hypothetical protein